MEVLAVQVVIAIVIFTSCLFGKGTGPVVIAIGLTLFLVFMPWLMALQLANIFFSACFGAMAHGLFTGTLNENPFKEPPKKQAPPAPPQKVISKYELALKEVQRSGKNSFESDQLFNAALNAGESKAHYHIALYAMNFGDYGKAKYHFYQSIAKNDPRGHVGLGLLEANRNHYWDARTHLTEAIKAGVTEAYYQLALVEDATNCLDEAALNYGKAIEYGNNEAHAKLGTVYYRQNLIEKARASFMQAIAVSDPEALYYMGVFEFKLGNLEKAKCYLLKAMDTRTVDATYYMAYIHYETGDFKTAIAYLDKFSYLSNPDYSRLRQDIERASKKVG
jgi:tetratricopeptide (TPR) repeat protein